MANSQIVPELTQDFANGNYKEILIKSERLEINPSNDPISSNIIAASLFQLQRYEDCLLWCEGLVGSLGTEASFASMYGAALRRCNQQSKAELIFSDALKQHPDNITLKNNYANLLIDICRYDEARNILEELIVDFPNYEDAKANLRRLELQQSLSPKLHDTSEKITDGGDTFLEDPMVAAFSDEEVTYAGGLSASRVNDNIKNSKALSGLPIRLQNKELDEMLLLARESVTSNPQQSLEDCMLIHNQIGAKADIYELAGEAYIQLKLFEDAERSLFTALCLDGSSVSIYINLANLACMRGDQLLAVHWLEKATMIDVNYPNLKKVSNALFPNGKPQKSSQPFSISESKAVGQFIS